MAKPSDPTDPRLHVADMVVIDPTKLSPPLPDAIDSTELSLPLLDTATMNPIAMNLGSSEMATCAHGLQTRSGSLQLLDLPTELLWSICGYLTRKHRRTGYNNEIENLRLSCRRLYDLSSRFLVNVIRVGMNPASLDRLEKIVNHPLIGCGVSVIQVDLEYFSKALIEDPITFAIIATKDPYKEVECIQDGVDEFPQIVEQFLELGTLGLGYAGTVRALSTGDGVLQKWFIPAFADYKHKYSQQQSALKNGRFLQSLRAAFLKLPIAECILMTDRIQKRNFQDLFSKTAEPMGWRQAWDHRLRDQPYELLHKLLLMILTSGFSITNLAVNARSIPIEMADHVTEEQRHALVAGSRNLKSFIFTGGLRMDLDLMDQEQLSKFGVLLSWISALSGGENLRHLGLGISNVDQLQSFSGGKVLTSQLRPNLEVLHLWDCSLDFSDLKVFLGSAVQLRVLNIINLHLLSGTWAETLELVREALGKVQDLTEEEKTKSQILGGFGAECDDLSNDELQLIMHRGSPTPSSVLNQAGFGTATHYIRGADIRNPFDDTDDKSTTAAVMGDNGGANVGNASAIAEEDEDQNGV